MLKSNFVVLGSIELMRVKSLRVVNPAGDLKLPELTLTENRHLLKERYSRKKLYKGMTFKQAFRPTLIYLRFDESLPGIVAGTVGL